MIDFCCWILPPFRESYVIEVAADWGCHPGILGFHSLGSLALSENV